MPVSPGPPKTNNHHLVPQQRGQKLAPKAAVPPPPPPQQQLPTSRPRVFSPHHTSPPFSKSAANINHGGLTTTGVMTTATTTVILPALGVATHPPTPFPDGRPVPSIITTSPSFPPSGEDYQARMREWHNFIGKKYRNKLNDKFEGLQAVLVHVASHPDLNSKVEAAGTSSTSSGSPRGPISPGGKTVDEDHGNVTAISGAPSPVISNAERLEVLMRMQEDEEELRDDRELYDGDEDGAEDDDEDADAGRASPRGGIMRRPRRRRTKGINKASMLAMARKTIVRLATERDQLLIELAEAGADETG